MSRFRDARRAAIARRFPPRPDLPKEAIWQEFFADLPRAQVLECLGILEEDLVLPVGMLRPDDSLTALLAPVPTWNPIWWLRNRSIESDHVLELRQQLGARQQRTDRVETLYKLGDLVRAWCGALDRSNDLTVHADAGKPTGHDGSNLK